MLLFMTKTSLPIILCTASQAMRPQPVWQHSKSFRETRKGHKTQFPTHCRLQVLSSSDIFGASFL
eukprot:2871488-Amphidinium_carterae.1